MRFYPAKPLLEPLLQVGLERYEGRSANGDEVNNRLDLSFDTVKAKRPALVDVVIDEMCTVVAPLNPDLLIPVPYHGNEYARQVALRRNRRTGSTMRYLPLDRHPVTGDIYYTGNPSLILERFDRVVIINALKTDNKETNRVIAALGHSEAIKAEVSIFDCGDDATRDSLPQHIATYALAKLHIPDMLEDASPLWEYVDRKGGS